MLFKSDLRSSCSVEEIQLLHVIKRIRNTSKAARYHCILFFLPSVRKNYLQFHRRTIHLERFCILIAWFCPSTSQSPSYAFNVMRKRILWTWPMRARVTVKFNRAEAVYRLVRREIKWNSVEADCRNISFNRLVSFIMSSPGGAGEILRQLACD